MPGLNSRPMRSFAPGGINQVCWIGTGAVPRRAVSQQLRSVLCRQGAGLRLYKQARIEIRSVR